MGEDRRQAKKREGPSECIGVASAKPHTEDGQRPLAHRRHRGAEEPYVAQQVRAALRLRKVLAHVFVLRNAV